ncbi:MAG: MBL fold metallo-hydrolase [Bacteroidetes bacterium]|nr:MBL fold metallo-hydrolase [Bacteroidota bacterium]
MRTIVFSFLSLLFLSNVKAQDVINTSEGSVTIKPVTHASLVLLTSKTTIYIDPTGGMAAYTGVKLPDVILVTDIHGDHFDPKTIAAVKAAATVLIVPKAVSDKLPDSLKANAIVMANGDKKDMKGFSLTALPMYNLPESPQAMHTKGRGNGYVVTIGGKNFYISGDTQGIPEMRALKNIDVAFICMNLPYTMDINEAADAVLAFKPKIVYPYHYRGQGGFSDVEGFKKLVEAKDKNIDVRLRDWYPKKG